MGRQTGHSYTRNTNFRCLQLKFRGEHSASVHFKFITKCLPSAGLTFAWGADKADFDVLGKDFIVGGVIDSLPGCCGRNMFRVADAVFSLLSSVYEAS